MSQPSERHLDRFSRFFAQYISVTNAHTDTLITLRLKSVATGHIYAMYKWCAFVIL